jgi:Domain of unknown function (DUF4365)
MESFSEAYVRGMAAREGLSVIREAHDVDNIDIVIAAYGHVEHEGQRSRGCSPRIGVQLKCSGRYEPRDGMLQHDLPVRNYEDLRSRDHVVPRVLVVVCVPPDWEQRLDWSPEALVLRHCAFWASLVGLPPTNNRRTCRVTLRQYLSPRSLTHMLYCIAQEQPLP